MSKLLSEWEKLRVNKFWILLTERMEVLQSEIAKQLGKGSTKDFDQLRYLQGRYFTLDNEAGRSP